MVDTYVKQMESKKFEDIQEIVDYISELLHCPVTIEDSEHRLLGYSKHDARTDPARIETIISRQVPYSVTVRLWKSGILAKLNESHKPIRIEAMQEIGLGNRVAVAIRHKQTILGYIWIVELDNALTNQGMLLLHRASEILKKLLMKRALPARKKDQDDQQFLLQLLSGGISSNELINEKLQQKGIVAPRQIAVVVFSIENTKSKRRTKQLLDGIITVKEIELLFSLEEGQDVILLIANNKAMFQRKILNEFIKDTIRNWKNHYHLSASGSVGQIYDNLLHARKSYEEAMEVLALKQSYPTELLHVYQYEELGIFQHIRSIAERRQLEDFTYTPLKELLHYDEKQQTELVKTVEAFLDNDCRVNDAAQMLHIHPNTLNYRIKRVVEITGLQLQDPIAKMALYLELKLREWRK